MSTSLFSRSLASFAAAASFAVVLALSVTPATHGIYAYQAEGETPQGQKGKAQISTFSSTGTLGTSFATANAQAETIALDSSGRIFFPNHVSKNVQIFSSSGPAE